MDDPIFISYSRRDQEFVLKLASDLELRGATVWIDRGDIQAGERWRESIERGIADCRAFLLVISDDSLRSEYVNEELSTALRLRKPIFPLIYRKTRIPPELAPTLNAFQRLDFRKGGYSQNFADLVSGLRGLGVPLEEPGDAPDDQEAQRRRERLGAPVPVRWGSVFGKVPGWALAWALGWTIYWIVLPILIVLLGDSSSMEDAGSLLFMPIGGFVGGLAGGLLAGLVTMLALRRHATNIAWKHMSPSIRIWGLVGPIGTVAAGALALLLVELPFINLLSDLDCSTLSFGDCFGEIVGRTFGSLIGSIIVGVIVLALAILAYALIALFLLGVASGVFAVRHIRRLEPGILGRLAFWVVLGWGAGAVVASIVPFTLLAALEGG